MDFDIPEIQISKYEEEFARLEKEMSNPENASDYELIGRLNTQIKDIQQIIDDWNELQEMLRQYEENTLLASDPEFAEMAEAENTKIKQRITKLSSKLISATLPKLENDGNNAIIEIRAGTGGTEASLFAAEIYRMYTRYANSLGFKLEQLSTSYHEEGGIKEVTFLIKGAKAFGSLRFESGVHRVQRVPSTESSGRIHTSAVSVAVIPEIETKDVEINDSDLKIETFRSSGPGGQSVNTTDSAVRITHIPSNITVSCQDGKSQHKNKEKALSILASKLYTLQQEEIQKATNEIRSSAIKSGDRSAKIRTYNFPQGRITDHRIKESWFNITQAMEGDIDEIVSTTNNILRKQVDELETSQ